MRAVSAERFVQALCIGIISPQQLGQMAPTEIDWQLKALKTIDDTEWEAKKMSWSSQKQSGDPEHLPIALQRLSRASNQGGSNGQSDQNKSYRIDDHEAIQAVFERRRLKNQQKDDQEAVQAVMDRRKSKDSPSRSTDANKEPRLPSWAENVVKKAQIPTPSSPAPPKSPSYPNFALRPQPKTPFK